MRRYFWLLFAAVCVISSCHKTVDPSGSTGNLSGNKYEGAVKVSKSKWSVATKADQAGEPTSENIPWKIGERVSVIPENGVKLDFTVVKSNGLSAVIYNEDFSLTPGERYRYIYPAISGSLNNAIYLKPGRDSYMMSPWLIYEEDNGVDPELSHLTSIVSLTFTLPEGITNCRVKFHCTDARPFMLSADMDVTGEDYRLYNVVHSSFYLETGYRIKSPRNEYKREISFYPVDLSSYHIYMYLMRTDESGWEDKEHVYRCPVEFGNLERGMVYNVKAGEWEEVDGWPEYDSDMYE